jgi:hypothetical protein
VSEVRRPQSEHPSPHRERLRLGWLLGALAAGPTGWIVQLVIGYGVASHACRPRDAPRLAPPQAGWDGERIGLVILNLVCLALILGGGAIALKAWRRTRQAGRGEIPVRGESRMHFLAACGILIAAGFSLATLFDTVWPLFIPSCWRFT